MNQEKHEEIFRSYYYQTTDLRMSMATDPVATTDMNMDADLGSRLEAFFYTPYGLATLAGITIIVTSIVWTISCTVYCCCRHKRHEAGVAEANRDILFFGDVSHTYPASDGTLSSGYNTGPQVHSMSSYSRGRNGSTTQMLNTSLDSMLDASAY